MSTSPSRVSNAPATATPTEATLAEATLAEATLAEAASAQTTAVDSPDAVILFDGVCNLCNSSINFIIDRDEAAYFRFASLQSDEARPLLAAHGVDPSYLDSVILVEDGTLYKDSTAALRIARRLKGWRWLYAFIVVPRFLRDAVYTFIANNRYRWFGKQDTCRIPTPELRARFL